MSGETTRRGLIARAIAAGAGAGLLGPSDAGAAQVPAGDSALLHTVLASELLAVYCYQRVLASGLLDGRTMRLATQVLVQERAHVRAVRGALAASGGVPPQAPASPAAADRELSILLVPNRLAELHNREATRQTGTHETRCDDNDPPGVPISHGRRVRPSDCAARIACTRR